jgi:hypothetical protein
MTIRLLTTQQKDLLIGKQWGVSSTLDPIYFNPQQDAYDNWFISNQEVLGCTLQNAITLGIQDWILTLPEIPFVPKPSNPLP